MPINNQIVGGNFTDLQGAPLALGYLIFQLSQDEQSAVPGQICAGRKIRVDLDNTGNIPASPAVYLFANDALNPANSYYTVRAYTAEGQIVWGPQVQQVLSSPSPFNASAWVPNSINTGSTPAPTITLKTNGVNNDSQVELNLTGTGGIAVSQSAGTVTIAGAGGSSLLQSASVTLASSDILTGFRIQIVPAPGANKILWPVTWYAEFVPNTTPYSGAGNFDLKTHGIIDTSWTNTGVNGGGFWNQVQKMVATAEILPGFGSVSGVQSVASLVNFPLDVVIGTNPTSGDGSVVVTVIYYVLSV